MRTYLQRKVIGMLGNTMDRLKHRVWRAWENIVRVTPNEGRDAASRFAPRQLATQPCYVSTTRAIPPDAAFFEVEITLDLPPTEARRYEYSKLYCATGPRFRLSETHVVTFRVDLLRTPRRIRILIPAAVKAASAIRIRIDPAPLAKSGEYTLTAIRILPDDVSDISHIARLEAHKEWVRRQVETSEASGHPTLDHYPSALIFELTPRCNLTCAHCSSHGQPDLHRAHNRMQEMSPAELTCLAEEVFPSLTSICLVGRGEPTMVSERLWRSFTDAIIRHRVLLSIITNGYFVRRRITPELLPFIDNITFSIDGIESKTFAANRVGASFEKVWDAVEWFHDLRRHSQLARRPRLNFSWTLKRNNIAEFPKFVRRIASVEADALYTRHLLVYFEKDREQSLIDEPALANPYLREAYGLLARHNIGGNCMPLIAETAENHTARDVTGTSTKLDRGTPHPRDGCIFIRRTGVILADGEVPTCGAPFVRIAGAVNQASSFMSVWNGPVMKDVRMTLNTSAEMEQCQNCWFREGAYQRQRAAIAAARWPDIMEPTSFTNPSWDFREKDKTPCSIANQGVECTNS